MAKVYYTEQETCAKLNVSETDLNQMTRDGKLRAFQDGPRRMYKVDEVEKLAAAFSSGDSGEIQLTPADSAVGTGLSLAEADKPHVAGKEDTVITAEGISIFDAEDLEVAADPMAKTQISASLDEHMDGVGSGSGLLDLTRESDDTSLGAEVLDHIDMEGVGSGMGSGVGSGMEINEAEAPIAAPVGHGDFAPTYIEETDAGSGAFSGMIIAATLVALLSTAVAAGLANGMYPGIAGALKENIVAVLVGSVVIIAVAAIVGFVTGKSAAARQTALSRM